MSGDSITPLAMAKYDLYALRVMRELNRDGLPLVITATDSVRAACARYARGVQRINWLGWWALPFGERALVLHHQRAVLAWLTAKARLIWLDNTIAEPIDRLADRVAAFNAKLRAPTPSTTQPLPTDEAEVAGGGK